MLVFKDRYQSLVLFCEIQLFPQVLEDFLKLSMVGDLHVVLAPGAGWVWRFITLVAGRLSVIFLPLENTLLGLGCCFSIRLPAATTLHSATSFLPLDENTIPIQFLIPWLFESPESSGGFFSALRRFLDTQFNGLGFATAEPSLDVLSRALLDMTLGKKMVAGKHREIHDIQQTKEMVPPTTCEASFG